MVMRSIKGLNKGYIIVMENCRKILVFEKSCDLYLFLLKMKIDNRGQIYFIGKLSHVLH